MFSYEMFRKFKKYLLTIFMHNTKTGNGVKDLHKLINLSHTDVMKIIAYLFIYSLIYHNKPMETKEYIYSRENYGL